MTQEELRQLARIGAEARLRELEREIQTIRTTFPELRGARPGRRRGRRRQATASAGPKRQARGRSNMSAAARKRIAEAQRKRWAEWRKQREGKK